MTEPLGPAALIVSKLSPLKRSCAARKLSTCSVQRPQLLDSRCAAKRARGGLTTLRAHSNSVMAEPCCSSSGMCSSIQLCGRSSSSASPRARCALHAVASAPGT
eukprot:scaffold2434_cov278-Prasinococcus_capsulatus_cf.AAC.4